MSANLRPALIIFGLLTLLTGVVYPLLVTGIAQVAFPAQANGSLVSQGEVVVGSELIGQNFSEPQYFWARLSATSGQPYTPFDGAALLGSSGANLGPLSQALVNAVSGRVEALRAADPGNLAEVPVDLATYSASGLDPHISPAAAAYQVARVAEARGLEVRTVQALVDDYTEGRQFGFLGEARVNVLLLNLALDELQDQ